MRLGWGNIRGEVGHEVVLFYPPVPVAIRLERLGGLRHGRFDRRTALTFIKRKCRDVDQCRNVWIIASLGDNGPAVAIGECTMHQNHVFDASWRRTRRSGI